MNKPKLPTDYQYLMGPEDLPEEYRSMCFDGGGMKMFSHPFMHTMFPLIVDKNGLVAHLSKLEDRAADLMGRGDLQGAVFMRDRPYRAVTLVSIADQLAKAAPESTKDPRTCAAIWKLAEQVWTDCEEPEDDDIWESMMYLPFDHKELFMSSKDRRALRGFGESFRVWRGIQVPQIAQHDVNSVDQAARAGFSWTTSHRVAETFSKRLRRTEDVGVIVTCKVSRYSVAAYTTGRGENEIIIDPSDLPEEISLSSFT